MTLPPDEIPINAWLAQLREVATHERPKARRMALLRLVWQEAYLTREGLIARVEDVLGRGCFGASPRTAFYRDMAVLRQTLGQAGHRLIYSRQQGYYIEGRPRLDERLQRLIAGAVAEVDPKQIAVSRRLTPAEQFQQGRSMVELAERVATYRLRQRQPHLSEEQARRAIREKTISP